MESFITKPDWAVVMAVVEEFFHLLILFQLLF